MTAELQAAIERRVAAKEKLAATEAALKRGQTALAEAERLCPTAEISERIGAQYQTALESGSTLEIPENLIAERRRAFEQADNVIALSLVVEKLSRRVKVEIAHLESAAKAVELAAEQIVFAESLEAAKKIEALETQIEELRRALFADSNVYLRANGRAIRLSPGAYTILRTWNENPFKSERRELAEKRRLAASERFRAMLEPA